MIVDEAHIRNQIQPAYTILQKLQAHEPVPDHFVELALKQLQELFKGEPWQLR